ncbi:MAG: tetratricopeptide repeat protein [Chloroflexi bacterium]|nr:MAG: tetratricopeptide repeat protein [Chloroflexota bacterium]
MIIKRTPPRPRRRGPSCLFVLFILFGVVAGAMVIANAEEVREAIIPTPTPEPTRSAAEYALLADLSEKDGEYEEAIQYYEEALRLDATKPEIFIRLINLLVQENQPERALEVAEQVTILAPDNDAVWTAVAAAYLANGDRLASLGDVTGANLQYAQASQAANKAIEINPENATAYAYAAAGLVLQEDPNKYERAQELASFAVALEPDNPIARLYMGIVLTYQGFYTAAREQFQLGIQSDPSLADLHIQLAYNYFGTGSVPDAILSFEQAIAVDPDNAIAYDGLAYMYLQLGEDALAIENATEAVKLDPGLARAHGRLGEAYFRQSNYPNAIAELEKAVELYGEATDLNARFFNMLATAYIRSDLNLCPKAVPLFEKVLEVASANPLLEQSAREGLEECRRAVFETEP